MSRLLVIGAGGHGLVVADSAEASGHWSDIAFVDDVYPRRKAVSDWRILGPCAAVEALSEDFDAAIAAFGDSKTRLQFRSVIVNCGLELATVCHPSAVVSSRSSIGPGTVLLANSVVNAMASVGAACIINTGATVDHHCRLADGVHIAPGASLAAEVTVGQGSWIGAGATVKEQTVIGDDVLVAAGAVVIRDVESGLAVCGVPARPMRSE